MERRERWREGTLAIWDSAMEGEEGERERRNSSNLGLCDGEDGEEERRDSLNLGLCDGEEGGI